MDLEITLDREANTLLSHQIGRALIDLIANAAMPAGVRLPATRVLARQLGVARMTVVEAYEWLAAQGYVETRHGSGTFVRHLPLVKLTPAQKARLSRPQLSPTPLEAGARIDFKPGLPDLASFPRRQWLSALAQSVRSLPAVSFGYGDPLGHERLRQALAAYLYRSRGLAVDARNVVVTAGAAQAVDVLLRALPQHREIIIEAPAARAQHTLPATYGVTLRKVPIDQEGICTHLLPEKLIDRPLVYVTPSHQLPLGCAMSIERRLALLAWAMRTEAFVIEDDYDSEFAYDGRPVVPLAKLDAAGRVIYTGTFSKTLAPALRIGFMVVPDFLLQKIAGLKWWVDHGGWTLQQDALAQWIEQGPFERHVLRMRKIYRDRFLTLTEELTSRLGSRVRMVGQPVGMHVAALVRSNASAEEIAARALAQEVRIYPIEGAVRGAGNGELAFVFGFGNVTQRDIVRGAKVFANAVLAS
jgi:GntR family transcriptional regulator/MocR family aminotransferase